MITKQPLLAAGLLLNAVSFNAQSALSNVVYSSVSDGYWTQDANLLGTLETTLGFDAIVNAIIAASPTVSTIPGYWDGYDGIYQVSAADFDNKNLGQANWWGAVAFTHYLNSIHYGNSSQWALPSIGENFVQGYYQTGGPMGQLFYDELGGTAGQPLPDTPVFNNEQNSVITDYMEFLQPGFYMTKSSSYWLNEANGAEAWYFATNGGWQTYDSKRWHGYIWAFTPHLGAAVAAPVPVPGAAWLFGTALLGFAGFTRRRVQ